MRVVCACMWMHMCEGGVCVHVDAHFSEGFSGEDSIFVAHSLVLECTHETFS